MRQDQLNEEFDWRAWIQKIEEAAEDNEPLVIDLPLKEYQSLKREGLTLFKRLFSGNTARRLILLPEDPIPGLLVRTFPKESTE